MQTILGAGGAIGRELARSLTTYEDKIRLVSRHPQAVNPGDECFKADLTNADEVNKAVEGSDVVYLTVGLPYSTRVWQNTWPVLMNHVISACQQHQARLVFFDNVYMYDPDRLDGMTESTPMNPSSSKGIVREELVNMLMDEVEAGRLQALIARAADFYGPSIKGNSLLTETVFKNLSQGKKANWLMSDRHRHSFTYTPDAARATALLGNTADAFNQTWHLPTAPNPMTGHEWIETIAREMGVPARTQVVPKFLVQMLGLFMPVMRESVEMLYQYDRDYVFDSSKFVKTFGIEATPYLEGIKEIVARDYHG